MRACLRARMRSRAGYALSALLAAGLAGCVKPPPPAPQASAPPPTTMDGRYRGVARLVQGGRGCPRSGARVKEVRAGVVPMSYVPAPRQVVQLDATVQADGKVHAEDGVGTVDGTLRDGKLEMSVITPLCEHRWFLTKVEPGS